MDTTMNTNTEDYRNFDRTLEAAMSNWASRRNTAPRCPATNAGAPCWWLAGHTGSHYAGAPDYEGMDGKGVFWDDPMPYNATNAGEGFDTPQEMCWYENDDFHCNLEANHDGNHLDITYDGYWTTTRTQTDPSKFPDTKPEEVTNEFHTPDAWYDWKDEERVEEALNTQPTPGYWDDAPHWAKVDNDALTELWRECLAKWKASR